MEDKGTAMLTSLGPRPDAEMRTEAVRDVNYQALYFPVEVYEEHDGS